MSLLLHTLGFSTQMPLCLWHSEKCCLKRSSFQWKAPLPEEHAMVVLDLIVEQADDIFDPGVALFAFLLYEKVDPGRNLRFGNLVHKHALVPSEDVDSEFKDLF